MRLHVKLGSLGPMTGYPLECVETSDDAPLTPGYDTILTVEGLEALKESFAPQYAAWQESLIQAERQKELRQAVNTERDRRVSQGMIYTTNSGVQIPVDTRDERDFRNLQGLASECLVRRMGNQNIGFDFTGADNQSYQLSRDEMLSLCRSAMARTDTIYKKARALKALPEIPEDYASDTYWG